MGHLKYGVSLYWVALKRLFFEGYTTWASALAFATLLAIVPLFSVVLSFISAFPMFSTPINLAREFILANFIPTSRDTIEHYLNGFIEQSMQLPTLGLVFSIVTIISLAMVFDDSLREVWKSSREKKNLLTKILHWGVVLLTPFFIALSVFLSSLLFSLTWFEHLTSRLGLYIPLLASVPLFINIGIFTFLYMSIPSHSVNWRDGILGSCTASVLFEIGKKSFALYISHFHSYELIYGTLATIPIFLLWLYISWLIVLYGALVVQTQSELRNKI